MSALRVKVLAVAQDPGGASVLIPVLRALVRRQGVTLRVLTRGPAGRLLREAGIPGVVESSAPSNSGWAASAAAEFAARRPSVLVAATSFPAGFETAFIRAARQSGVPSLVVLDGWSNYAIRFLAPGETGLAGKLPDAICVMDERAAEEMRRQGFPADAVRVTGHPALDAFVRFSRSALAAKAAARLRRRLGLARGTRVVAFMSQPISELYGGPGKPASRGYDEFDALDALQRALQRQNGKRVQLVIRPHPKEPAEKFQQALAHAGVSSQVMADGSTDELVLAADLVVGMTSTTLVKALMANRPALSLQPGLRGEDTLVLSRMGLMRPVTRARALAGALRRQLTRSNGSAPRLPSTWTDGRAAERILAVVDELLARPRLAGNRVLLRPLEPDDAKGPYPSWFNDPEVCRGTSHGEVRYTEEDARRYIEHARTSRTDLIFAVVRRDQGRHIGNIALKRIDPAAKSGELAILIGDKASWGQGFAAEACRLLLDHAFFTLKLHRVHCGTFENNTAMRRLAAALGMEAEGRRRQAAFKAGRFLDVVEYGVLRAEYARRRAGTRSQ